MSGRTPLAELSRTTTYGNKSHTDTASRHRRDLYRLWPVVPEKEPNGRSWLCCYRILVTVGWPAASYLGYFVIGFLDFNGASTPYEVRRIKPADLKTMPNLDIDRELIATLGGGSSPGIEPTGLRDRLNAQPDTTKQIVESYLARTTEFPLPKVSSLSEIADIVLQWLSSEMPELSDLARRKLSNYYTYQWR